MRLVTGTTMLAALAMAGCATMPPMEEPKGPCAVDEALRMRFTGMAFKARMRDEIRDRANAPIARVLRPGDITTKEFREDRLNIMVDDAGRIEGFRCG